jgi:lipoic acid synthetase
MIKCKEAIGFPQYKSVVDHMQKKHFKRRGYIIDIDLMEYQRAWDLQREVVAAKLKSDLSDILILLEHNPVITLGRRGNRRHLRASPEVLAGEGIEIYHVERGGEVTYHGPGQIVGYPLLNLRNWHRDVSWYIFNVEEVLIRTLGDFGIEGTRNGLNRGVWVGDSVSPDMNHYHLITPCGLEGIEVTSIERILGGKPDHRKVRVSISRHFQHVFDMELARMDMEDLKGILEIPHQAHEKTAGV